MATYIDALPKELRTELQYFRYHVLNLITNVWLEKHTRLFRLSSEKEAIWLMGSYKDRVVPTHIQSEVVYASNYTDGYVRVLPTHIMTPQTLYELCNSITQFDRPSGWKLLEELQYLNDELKKNGFKEQLLCHITSEKYTIVLSNDPS